mgnify:FL=1|tara:strand:- start:9719 stop:10546 length:828 start_codon:yes stop_codon:yes gene_type:complete
MKTMNKKFKIFCGGVGSGKTTSAIKEFNGRPFITLQANNIWIEDIYSYPKNHGILIEEVNYKPDKDKILKILYVLENVVLTSLNEKDVPKAIMNLCQRKRKGQVDYRQRVIKNVAPNSVEVVKYEKSIYELTEEFLNNSNREKVLELVKYNKPADLQFLSWIQPNVDVRCISFADNIMRKWSMDYFYEVLVYSYHGNHVGRLAFPKRNSYSPVPKICNKLGLRAKDSYLVKSLLQNEDYKNWAISKLDKDECKILGLKKPRKKSIRLVNTKLGDW